MKHIKDPGYTYSFMTSETPEEIFKKLLDIRQWWSGIYSETIVGESKSLNDEFSFEAGGGAHYSKQKLVELVPNQRIVWEVTESSLSFIADKSEWTFTNIEFDIEKAGKQTKVTFKHAGLTPQLECYESCSRAWSQYMEKLYQSTRT